MSIVAKENLHLNQMDVETDLKQIKGEKVLMLDKSLYSLKQAGK